MAANKPEQSKSVSSTAKFTYEVVEFNGVVIRHAVEAEHSVVTWVNGSPREPVLWSSQPLVDYKLDLQLSGSETALKIGEKRRIKTHRNKGGER